MLWKSPFRARILWQSGCYFTFPGSFTSVFFFVISERDRRY